MILLLVALALIGLVVAGEMVVRRTRAMDLPLFDAGNRVGYIPKPNQAGRYLNRYDWCFNDQRMGVAEPFDLARADNVLLVGDSVVFGELGMRQVDRLGPTLRRRTGLPVWPLAAPGWSLQNELAALEGLPEVVAAASDIVFVLNSADFTPAISWKSQAQHRIARPWSALAAVAYRMFRKRFPPKIPPAYKVPMRDWRPMLVSLAERSGARIRIVLYPDRAEAADRILADRRLLRQADSLRAVLGDVAILDVGADPFWSPAFYADAIHPSVGGASRLAEIIAAWITEAKPVGASIAA